MHNREKVLAAPQKEAQQMIRENILESWKVACWSIGVVYDNQTESEKMSSETTQNNGVGFSGPDARNFTFWAKLIRESGPDVVFSNSVRANLSQKICKYSRQILEHLRDLQEKE